MRLINTTRRATGLFALLSLSMLSAASSAQEFVWGPELTVGSKLTPISAVDQSGTTYTIQDLVGEKGLVLVMSRSYEWCPYCIRQLGQLVEAQDEFAALGLNVATMTYDPVSILTEAALDHGAEFPMLSDAPNYTHVKAMGILNAQYAPDERAYGIPYPGIFLLDASGTIRAKFAEEDYKVRPDFSLVLDAAAKL
jgi:peroxiredoxin